MSGELFNNEAALIDKSRQMLDNSGIWSEEARGAFETLLKGFERHAKHSRRLMKVSDKLQAEVRQSQDKLEKLNAEQAEQALQLEDMVVQRTAAMRASQQKLNALVDMSTALSAERDPAKLMEQIMMSAKKLCNADGGTLYLRTDEDQLEFEIVHTDSLGIRLGGLSGNEINFPPVSMFDPESGAENHNNVVSYAAISGEVVNISDVYETEGFDFSGTKRFDQTTGFRSKSFLTVPMKNRKGRVIGVLQLLNATDPDSGEVYAFDGEAEQFVSALATQGAVTLENTLLLEEQRQLLDSFIELIAAAIDAKSPYTGGHCSRVPEVATMLAKKAEACTDGPFADFSLTEDQWYEFHIGAWLHDCGKVTTPEYVVDKATKLETIYNRVHEIRMRFEVLIRDAELDYWKSRVAGVEDEATLSARRDAEIAALTDDFAFIAECNIGGEFMDEEHIKRVEEIGDREWVRNLDDRLGISMEETRLKPKKKPKLPVVEKLLANKQEHIIPRAHGDRPWGDNPYGFNMKVPTDLYNRGERHNLCIQRGTLTDEERFKINEHIIQTIIMLEQLPFPRHLAQVPEIAGAHHETMIGTGYPRGLKREEMSLPARAMAIADIFEALTASDRPYKKAKTLSESIRIMSFMRNDQHIDPDLFELFLRSGVWQDYADRYLEPEQVDEVDISQYLD